MDSGIIDIVLVVSTAIPVAHPLKPDGNVILVRWMARLEVVAAVVAKLPPDPLEDHVSYRDLERLRFVLAVIDAPQHWMLGMRKSLLISDAPCVLLNTPHI